jgi:hypothetical protein
MGSELPGDVFAHWDEPDLEERLAKLRAILESEVPKILGTDNSLVLATFPTKEQIADIKKNVPYYNAPSAKAWQKPFFWADHMLNRRAP